MEELRISLGLVDEDHYAAIRVLAISDPRILHLDHLQLDSRSLRQQAASQALANLVQASNNPQAVLTNPRQQDGLEQIRRQFGLDDVSWQELLASFGPASAFAINNLEREVEVLRQPLAARQSLAGAAELEPLLNPLLPVIDRSIASCYVALRPGLSAIPADHPLQRQVEQLLRHCPAKLLGTLRTEDQLLVATLSAVDSRDLGVLPDPADVIDSLWGDPDPDTARWVLFVQGKRSPHRAEALLRQGRPDGLTQDSLDAFFSDNSPEQQQLLRRLLAVPMAAGLSPAALFNMVRWGELRMLNPGDRLFQVGDPANLVAILLEGQCLVLRGHRPDGQLRMVARVRAGEPIGDVAFSADHSRRAEVRAEDQPVQLLVFPAERFENLLQTSPEFSRSLLRQLALRIEDLYSQLALTAKVALVS